MHGKTEAIMKKKSILVLLLFLLSAFAYIAAAYDEGNDYSYDYLSQKKCSSDNDCSGYFCVHGTCRNSETYCGDKFCDPNEECSCRDCENDTLCHIELKKSDGLACVGNNECASGTCAIGTCISEATACGNRICEINESCSCEDCNNASACKPALKKVLDSQKCISTDNCLQNSFCVHGTCMPSNYSCGDGFCDTNETESCRDCNAFSSMKNDGEQCISAEDCGGGYCISSACASSRSICGDNACNTDERCNCPDCFNNQHCLVFHYASEQINSTLTALIILSLIMSGIIGALAFIFTWRGKHLKGEEKAEYTIKSLFMPEFKGKSTGVKLALILVNPFFWLLEAIIALGITFFNAMTSTGILGAGAYSLTKSAIIFSLGFPFFILFISWLIDYYEREPLRFVFGMFMWGLLSTIIPYIINTTFLIILSLLAGEPVAIFISTVLIAPFIEEIFKGLGLLIVSAHHEFDDISDGILYGFAIGIGFAFVENVTYILSGLSSIQYAMASGEIFSTPLQVTGAWLVSVFFRIFISSIGHGTTTAIVGLFIGLFKQKYMTGTMRLAGFGVGLTIAITLHMLNNFIAALAGVAPLLVLVLPFIDYSIAFILLIVTIVWQIKKARKDKEAAAQQAQLIQTQ